MQFPEHTKMARFRNHEELQRRTNKTAGSLKARAPSKLKLLFKLVHFWALYLKKKNRNAVPLGRGDARIRFGLRSLYGPAWTFEGAVCAVVECCLGWPNM